MRAKVAFRKKTSYALGSRCLRATHNNEDFTMKTKKTPSTKAPRTSTRASAKKTPSAATKTAQAPTPLTSPRVTKAAARAGALVAANAKKALLPTAPVAAATKSPKPTALKKPKAIAKPKPATSPAPQPVTTTIEAFIDVGFGNRLTLRGEGAAGLTWERGLTMNCLGSAEWVITLEATDAPLSFKFLLNDEHWSIGENYTLAPGKTGAFTPEF